MVAKDNASKLKLTSNVSLPVGSSYTILDIETVHSCALLLNIRFKETLNRERALKKSDTNLHAQNFAIEFHRVVSVGNFKDKM